jgi:predicted N-acetyltransferase YhbS
MLLQAATLEDLPGVAALINRAYRGNEGWAIEAKVMEGERIRLTGLREQLAENPEALQLIWRDEEDGSLLGSVWLEPVQDAAWYLGLLCMRPELQEKQLGRRRLAAAEETAKERGAHTMRISVMNVLDMLIAWYERRGYVKTGETQAFPYGDERFGRPMRDDLHFVVLEKAI